MFNELRVRYCYRVYNLWRDSVRPSQAAGIGDQEPLRDDSGRPVQGVQTVCAVGRHHSVRLQSAGQAGPRVSVRQRDTAYGQRRRTLHFQAGIFRQPSVSQV